MTAQVLSLGNAAGVPYDSAYADLKRLAASHLRRERPGHPLEASALVHETYLRLAALPDARWQDQSHFLSMASVLMRRILTDHARHYRAAKRGAGLAELCVDDLEIGGDDPDQFHDLGRAIARLASVAPRPARVVRLRFFQGLTEDEIAAHLRVCSRTVKRDWRVARAWLRGELEGYRRDRVIGSLVGANRSGPIFFQEARGKAGRPCVSLA